jgi:manganese-dependent inorganic pyrophosphatase
MDDAAPIYVTGHRNPDTDSIAAAVGFAELKARLNPEANYVPVRLGEVNAQSAWVLEQAGAEAPELLDHIMVRTRDVMDAEFPTASHTTPLREVGLAMNKAGAELMAIVDDDGRLCGVVTERDLARRYLRESSEPSSFAERPASVDSILQLIGGELLVAPTRRLDGRLWAVTTEVDSMGSQMRPDDIAIIGNRPDAQLRAVEIGVALLVSTYAPPTPEVIEKATANGVGVIVSPLDSYTTGRMIALSVHAGDVMSSEDILTTDPDDLAADVAERIKDVHYSAAIVVDGEHRPIGMVTPANLVSPTPRQVILVDHAETAQSVPGIEQAHIVEILDHHHIGSIETRFPVAATFDPIGSTASLVTERFRTAGLEPRRSTAILLLSAVLSDTVILSSPTTTPRDHEVVAYLEELLGLDAREFGTAMFTASSNVADVPALDIINRDAKEYQVKAGTICIAQIETVGPALAPRRDELLAALDLQRAANGYEIFALMVTDIVAKGTELLVSGEPAPLERVFGVPSVGRALDLPGVMSRKKQVAPQILEAM